MTGALASYMFFYPDRLPSYLNFLKSRSFSSLLLGLFFICIFLGVTFSFINHQAYSAFFAVLLFSISSSGIKPFFINNRLGKISYGIYMLHPVVVIVTLRLLIPHAYFTNSLQGIVIIDVIAVMITIAISMLAYELFEKMFLRSSNHNGRKLDDRKRTSLDLSLNYTEQKSF
jgi:peptidoglycan/LPS O-acetylase OafA/YrhL